MALASVKVGCIYSNCALSKFKQEIKAILPILREKMYNYTKLTLEVFKKKKKKASQSGI